MDYIFDDSDYTWLTNLENNVLPDYIKNHIYNSLFNLILSGVYIDITINSRTTNTVWLFVIVCKFNFLLTYDLDIEGKEQPEKSLNS